MLIIALVLAVISLAALVTAVVTSNELIAWVCIGLSALGVLLLIVDAIRDRNHRVAVPVVVPSDRTEAIASAQPTEVIEMIEVIEPTEVIDPTESEADVSEAEFGGDELADYPEDDSAYPEEEEEEEVEDEVEVDIEQEILIEDHPEEVFYDEPDFDTPSDDEPVYPVPAEEAAIHTVAEADLSADSATATYSELSEQAYADDSMTVIYPAESYAQDSHTVVVYADESDADESDEPRESDGGR